MKDNTFFFIFNFIKKFSRKFNEGIWRLVCAFDAFVAFVNSVSTSGSVSGSGADSRDSLYLIFFVGNILLLKLLRTSSLALKDNPKLLKKRFFFKCFLIFFKFF